MQVFRSISDFHTDNQTVVTIGTFDGVHMGHRRIIKQLVDESAEGESTLLTFFPHPRMVLQGISSVTLLNTIDERIALLREAGIENLIVHPFDATFANLDAEEFVARILVQKLKIRKIIIGHDHRFGVNRSAGIEDLMLYGKQFGFDVEQISPQQIDDVSVSSTKIRQALFSGDISRANSFLGYPYMLTGVVTKGQQLGRTLGFPTANLHIPEAYKLIPASGVYAVSSEINNQTVYGMMNIGTRPTVSGEHQTIETNFFDFSGDLYGKNLGIKVIERLRDEQKFSSVESLKKQLQQDEQSCRRVFGI